VRLTAVDRARQSINRNIKSNSRMKNAIAKILDAIMIVSVQCGDGYQMGWTK